MAMNQGRTGHVYPSYTYEVSREKIREYALALGETDPRFTSDGDDCVAPPTFAASFTVIRGSEAILADPELGAHTRLVHGSQRFSFGGRPLRPGDGLVCSPRIADITVRGANEMLTIVTDCRFRDTDESAVAAESVFVLLDSAPVDAGAGERTA